MIHLVYVSSAVKPFTDPELKELLARSRAKNHALGLTGMLLYKDGNFLQLLEGEADAVRALYAVIAQDPRHRDCTIIAEEPVSGRQFREWSMGFRNLSDPTLRELPGFSPFMNLPLTQAAFDARPGACLDLLYLFRERM
jgi:hypothetical protein